MCCAATAPPWLATFARPPLSLATFTRAPFALPCFSNMALMAMTNPGVQYPHCEAWHCFMATCAGDNSSPHCMPSTVTMCEPSICATVTMHEFMASNSSGALRVAWSTPTFAPTFAPSFAPTFTPPGTPTSICACAARSANARSTVHEPQSPSAHTIFVPVRPASLRSQSANIISASRPRISRLTPFK